MVGRLLIVMQQMQRSNLIIPVAAVVVELEPLVVSHMGGSLWHSTLRKFAKAYYVCSLKDYHSPAQCVYGSLKGKVWSVVSCTEPVEYQYICA